jgi:hypothetical protein
MEKVIIAILTPILNILFNKIIAEIKKKSEFDRILKKNQALADNLKNSKSEAEREKAVSRIASSWH